MEEHIQLLMDNVPVRFTQGGNIFVVDAIRAVSGSSEAADLWEEIKQKNPHILSSVRELKTKNATPVPVVDSDGWGEIQGALVDLILLKEYKKE